MAIDRFGRDIHYLRISLTDHCNLRCVYCMPEDMTFRPTAEMMQDDEVLLLAQLFASLGFDKIRLTGGEPLLRRDLPDLIRRLAARPAIRDLAMTTNGVLLAPQAAALRDAGLRIAADRVHAGTVCHQLPQLLRALLRLCFQRHEIVILRR